MTQRPRTRSAAEWTTFAVSAFIVLAIAGVIAAEAWQRQEPARPVARIAGRPMAVGRRFHVPVVVENEGDRTAEAVQVVVELKLGDQTIEADQVVDFLAGKDTQDLVFVFDDDPGRGALSVRVAGFTVP